MNVYRKERIVLILLLEKELRLQLMLGSGSIRMEDSYLFSRKEEKLLGGIKQ
jgi:hypothetical protein